MIEILARALGRGKFAAVMNDAVLVESTATPLFTAARVLSAAGYPDETELHLRHEGSEIVSIRSTVGRSKALSVVDGATASPKVQRFRSWGSREDEIAASDDTETKS